jgi:phosphatidylserine/phosphatidylglycerophosphate/cardiolipin synthase-like enzyme
MTDMTVLFLQDGQQPPEQVSAVLTAFLAGAASSIDIAIYDCALEGSPGNDLSAALQAAADRGVQVRLGYYAGPHRSPVIAPPAHSTQAFTSQLTIPVRPISGFRSLMHQKYVVRDVDSATVAVWTGSTNWTNDSWSREENIILQIPGQDLAALYHADFEQLWNSGSVENSGERDGGRATVGYDSRQIATHVWFSPGGGQSMAQAVADAISGAHRRIAIASPVLTDGVILGALRDVVGRGHVSMSGIYDATQMREVFSQWRDDAHADWKIDAFQRVIASGPFVGKRSTPYGPGTVHDYMHAKTIVIDDTVFTGSYNFSHSGEENAENLLRFDDAGLADLFAGFVQRAGQQYAAPDVRREP